MRVLALQAPPRRRQSWLLQFSPVPQSCPTLCDPMDGSTPGLPVHHQLPEFTQPGLPVHHQLPEFTQTRPCCLVALNPTVFLLSGSRPWGEVRGEVGCTLKTKTPARLCPYLPGAPGGLAFSAWSPCPWPAPQTLTAVLNTMLSGAGCPPTSPCPRPAGVHLLGLSAVPEAARGASAGDGLAEGRRGHRAGGCGRPHPEGWPVQTRPCLRTPPPAPRPPAPPPSVAPLHFAAHLLPLFWP